MRFILALVGSLVLATPAAADPFTFSFSGTSGRAALITRADGTVIDVALTAVTI